MCSSWDSACVRYLIPVALLLHLSAFAQEPLLAPEPPDPWLEATLYRDEWGVPHVYAENPKAMAFVFGYAQAEDHLEAMLLAYRVANGRAAEVLGEAYAESDAFSLRMAHGRAARRAFDNTAPATQELCTGFSQGVNAWLSEHPDDAPEWAEGVQPPDILALWHAFLMTMAPLEAPNVYRPPRSYPTGNAWALAPHRTAEGKATLVINPHQYHDSPFRWYEAHLVCGDLNVAGATLFGLPVIVQGHNEVLGWALTPNEPDFADVFEERFQRPQKRNPRDPRLSLIDADQVLLLEYMSHAQPYYVRTETGVDERYVPALVGARGPILEDSDGALYSWAIGGYRDFGGLHQLIEMGRARNLRTFQDALLMHQLPCFHVLYADHEGNIFYQYNVKTGVHEIPAGFQEGEAQTPHPADWKAPLPPDIAPFLWDTLIRPDALPWLLNPDSGYLQACGSPPWTVTDNAPLDPEAWPPWLAADADTYRARRVRQLLRTGERSLQDNHSMLYDVVAGAAVDLAPFLLQAADRRKEELASVHPDLPEALDLLRDWSYVAEPHAAGMTFYHVWWTMLQELGTERLGSNPALYAFLSTGSRDAENLALDAAAGAVRMMRNEFDTVSIPWGEVHRIHRGEREEPCAGSASGEPLFLASDVAFSDGRWHADYGYGYAMVVQFGERPEALSVAAFGASEDLESPHFDDQLNLLLEKRLKHTRFRQSEVWRYARSTRGRRVDLHPLGIDGTLRFRAKAPVDARLESSLEAPAVPPWGLVPFTLYVRAQHTPKEVAAELDVELFVPDVLCHEENLPQLALYTHDEAQGWRALEDQQLDVARRVLSASKTGEAVFVVFGPAACMESKPPEPEQEDKPEPKPETPVNVGPAEEVAAAL